MVRVCGRVRRITAATGRIRRARAIVTVWQWAKGLANSPIRGTAFVWREYGRTDRRQIGFPPVPPRLRVRIGNNSFRNSGSSSFHAARWQSDLSFGVAI